MTMTYHVRWRIIPALLSVCFLSASTSASAAGVRDEAGFFRKKVLEKADDEIAIIKQKYHKDLIIETFKAMPADIKARYSEKDAKAHQEAFVEWTRERARALRVNGICVLICREPPHVEVGVGAETSKSAFTVADRDELRKKLVDKFRVKQYDDGLLEAVAFVGDTFRRHAKLDANPEHRPVAEGTGTDWKKWILPGLLILGALWLVFGLIRAFSGMGARGGSGGGPVGGGGSGGFGGGGFMSGLMGGLLGAVAGNWLYNSMFGGGSHLGGLGGGPSAHADEPGAGDYTGSDDGRDFSTSGGDFGDSDTGGGDGNTSGGGDDADFGNGGDFSGGDFGGGDF